MPETINQIEFLDPFAEDNAPPFDPLASMDRLTERYKNNEIEHDYTADRFVSDTQALMMDAQFAGRFAEATEIAARMHMMCGEDHGLQQSFTANEAFKSSAEAAMGGHRHDPLDGIGHNLPNRDDHKHGAHAHHGHEDSEDEETKEKKKRRTASWLAFLLNYYKH